jgi:hypothetical protein
MDTLPKIWGRHDSAQIDALLVHGKVVTSIIDEPEQWSNRLGDLGFQRTPSSWLRIGCLSPSEWYYLSPEITLFGFMPDDVIDLQDDEAASNPVPYDVRNALLALWQRQVASVLVALSMEHHAHFTRSQAWSLVESALAGEITPETETLFGLAFTKMNNDGNMSEPALEYARFLGWTGTSANSPSARRPTLRARGEIIEWVDEGRTISGRLAQSLVSGANGCWAFEQSPVWAGGLLLNAPTWVRRDCINFNGSPLTKSKPVQDPAQARALEALGVSGAPAATMSPLQRKLLLNIINVDRGFPSPTWLSRLPELELAKTYQAGKDIDSDLRSEGLIWLKELEVQLRHLSAHYYSNDPLEFVLVNGLEGLRLTLGIRVGGVLELARDYSPSVPFDRDMALSHLGDQVERLRMGREMELRRSAQALADDFSLPGEALPLTVFARHQQSIWPSVSNHYSGQPTADSLYRILSVLTRSPDLKDLIVRFGKRGAVSDALNSRLDRKPTKGMGHVSISLSRSAGSLCSLHQILEALLDADAAGDWLTGTKMVEAEFYQVRLQAISGTLPQSVIGLPGLVVLEGDEVKSSSAVRSIDEALTSYCTALIGIAGDLADSDLSRLSILTDMAQRWPLVRRMADAITSVGLVPIGQLESFVESELSRNFNQRLSEWTESFKEGVVSSVAAKLREPGVQGVVVALGTRAGKRVANAEPIPVRDLAVCQSRGAEVQGAVADIQSRRRMHGIAIGIDAIALVDPELCSILNGEQSWSPLTERAEGLASTSRDITSAEISLAQLKNADRQALIQQAYLMTDHQRSKYLTKDLIWPRKSFDELMEAQVGLFAAYAYNLLWLSIPKSPKSTSRHHVNVFIHLLASVKTEVKKVMTSPEVRYTEVGNNSGFSAFASHLRSAVTNACDSVPDIRTVYAQREMKVRGYDLYWNTFDLTSSLRFSKVAAGLSWSGLLRSKDSYRPLPSRDQETIGVVRSGPDHRRGLSVSGEDFIKTFGFAKIVFGEWATKSERQLHLNTAFDAMLDFAHILGWEPMALSLGGKLGLHLGQNESRSSQNVSSFDSANYTVSLSKAHGSGNLAHEYFKAVANHLGKLATGSFQDVADLIGYKLHRPGHFPVQPVNGLRQQLGKTFFELMVSIMRRPDVASPDAPIEEYLNSSRMLQASLAADGEGRAQWSTPREMFARAMDAWFCERLVESGDRNDYLGSTGNHNDTELYPDLEELGRIRKYADAWLHSIVQDVKAVEHPSLGSIVMPVLNTEQRAVVPLSVKDLSELALSRLATTFKTYCPNLMLIDDPASKAGLYHLARNLLVLNTQAADVHTFNHESWHACHEMLLTGEEREGLAALFDPTGSFAAKVRCTMLEKGFEQSVVDHAMSDPRELQAYAYQMWAAGDLRFERSESFYKTKGFVDGVLEAAGMFTTADAEMLFTRFYNGELAESRMRTDAFAKCQGADHIRVEGDADPDIWDDENTLFFAPVVASGREVNRPRLG